MIEWLCGSVGLPLVEETEAGGLRLNDAARDVLGAAHHNDLVSALLPLMQQPDPRSLATCIDSARRGKRTELRLGPDLRALFAPQSALGASTGSSSVPPGLACVVLVPAQALERVSLERRALATDRSARVSHELANALGAIAGWARLAKEGARVDEALDVIEKSAESAWSTARTILGEVSGQSSDSVASVIIDLSAFVEEAARLLIPKALKKNVTVSTSITPGLCVAGERSSVWTIVWNLAQNAIEALPAGGSVSFQLTATGERVHLCVTDNGPGMSADVRAQIFDAYFTTKRTGSGLGLALVQNAVAELGGHLEVESEPERGTRFQIDLPRAMQAEKPRRRHHTSGKRSSGVFLSEHLNGRFLVIDDDPALREMIATALQMRGAQVVLAANLQEALANTGTFKLALVDFVLGDQRGDVVLARLREAGLVTTGMFVTGAEVPRKLAPQGEPDAVLRKPFELEDLYERVAEVLSQRSSNQGVAR